MDGRFNPYDSPGQQRQQAHALQAALEMEEALYLQRQQEMQRDLQIRQMLLQDQIDQQIMQAPTSMLQQQRLYELQNYAQNPLAALHEEQMLQQQLHQQEQLRRHQLQQEIQLSAALANQQSPTSTRRDYQADSAVADVAPAPPDAAARRPSLPNQRKRSSSQEDPVTTKEPPRKQAKKERSSSIPANESLEEKEVSTSPQPTKKKTRGKATKKTAKAKQKGGEKKPASSKKAAAASASKKGEQTENGDSTALDMFTKGTVEELVAAAESEQQVQDAAAVVVKLQEVEPWSDSESEVSLPAESIELPGFTSKLPRLMEEPEYDSSGDTNMPKKVDSTSENGTTNDSRSLSQLLSARVKKASAAAAAKSTEPKSKHSAAAAEYPFSVDTWWPSNTTIRRERRIRGENSDEEDTANDPLPPGEDPLFRADLASIRRRLVNEVEPGVLEKLPHCKIHRMRMSKGQKGGGKVEPVFCWQVTENTCDDVMLCCSVCSTWRHAFCGGHYKPFTIRSMLDSNAPFAPVCDRCHEEKGLLQDFPKAQARIERQRTEQLRRGLATSSVIRQASFAKHGGTYKWPLGSVSATHIGGHTRSVHSRHDKAEKQWAEMAVRLGRGLGYRPKERIKVRTRELERLLVAVEDAEGIMDRHNMMLFLQRDTAKDHPVGFARNRRNLFDPEDDHIEEVVLVEEPENTSADASQPDENGNSDNGDRALAHDQTNGGEEKEPTESSSMKDEENGKGNDFDDRVTHKRCARKGCRGKPRFDSMFCSDSCGVSALEMDLFRSLEYAGDIHPSLLRS